MRDAAPLKIAFLIVDLEIGGAQRVLERLVGSLDRRRFHPIVISLLPEGPLVHPIVQKGIRVVCLRMRGAWDLAAFAQLYEILRDFRPDVLHTFLFHANVVGRICGRLAAVPHIVSAVHTLEGRFYHFPLERLTWRLSDRVLFVSKAVARWAAAHAGIHGPATGVVYNGVDETVAVKPGLKTEFRLRPSRLVVTAARLTAGKGVKTFLRAAQLLAPRYPDVKFAVIGGGELDGPLREIARQLGIEERVHFAGWRDDVTRALAGCDVFVSASRLGEGLPNVILEAMIAGVPVVATDVGGTREAVVDGETGLIVPRRDPPALAKGIASLLDDPGRAHAMGERGRERAREHFSVGAMVERMQRIYDELSRKSRFV